MTKVKICGMRQHQDIEYANLLMPEQLVREMWKRWGSTEILADIFKVSLSAMSYRLYNLHLKGDW